MFSWKITTRLYHFALFVTIESVVSNSPEETKQFAASLLEKINGPKTLALYGNLGSGKTTFIQGLSERLGIERRILSPTFVFLRSYSVKGFPFKKFNHFDLYRAENQESARSVGIEEVLENNDSLVAIEWPEIIEELLPNDVVRIKFTTLAENKRQIDVS